MIREARAGDVAALQAIEVAAGAVFRTVGMDFVAGDEPLPAEVLLGYLRDGRAWVSVDEFDRPVGYLIADWVDGAVHVEQVSVDPGHARRGLGAELVEHVAWWAKERGAPALTLTTYADVAWNGPYYARLGFRVLPTVELTPGLIAIRVEEASHGLDRWQRYCMRRPL
jgi:GNAT superfamily N-acetyltransferase